MASEAVAARVHDAEVGHPNRGQDDQHSVPSERAQMSPRAPHDAAPRWRASLPDRRLRPGGPTEPGDRDHPRMGAWPGPKPLKPARA